MQDPKTPGELKKRRLAANWLDLELSSRAEGKNEAERLLRELGVPDTFIESALGRGALPRFDVEGEYAFLLLRVIDENVERKAMSVLDLTRKISVVACPKEIVTIHRFPISEFPVTAAETGDRRKPEDVIEAVLECALKSYTDAILRNEERLDSLEATVFAVDGKKAFRTKEGYYFKRQLAVEKRMLEFTRDALETASAKPAFASLAKKPYRRRLLRAIGATDSLHEGANQLLQLHMAIVSQKTNEASQRTNEVMRVLTVFSAFFLPLSFIAGVYGMNFEHMPELRHPHGYPLTIGLMLAVATFIYVWFRKRGWMGPPRN
jgi:magnesium transporter